jgi:hypothetical protein
MRVTRSRELVAEGYRPSAVARVAQISRQAINRTPKPRRALASPSRPSADEVEAAIVDVAMKNPTDGYRLGLIERAATERGIPPGTLTLGTDNGSAFTARALQGRPGRPGDHAPPRRLPRPREPSVHRVLVRQAQGALRLAARVRDPRRS